jgi:flagellar biosynthesis/type III secretory pathway protein FliH
LTLARGRLIKAGDAGRARKVPDRADDVAKATALLLTASARAGDEDERARDRIVALSRLLAERLIGRAIELSPETVVALAARVLGEARNARRVHVFVSPTQVTTLESATAAFDPEGRVHTITGDPSLGAGDIRLETELGAVEACVGNQLDRLALRLRDALRS